MNGKLLLPVKVVGIRIFAIQRGKVNAELALAARRYRP